MIRHILLLLTVLLAMPIFAQDNDIPVLTPPTMGDFEIKSVAEIDLDSVPVIPELTDHARMIYERRLESGQNTDIFSKVGDCMTASEYFMTPFGGDAYDLAEYEDLQLVVDYFSSHTVLEDYNSFSTPGLATTVGFNTASVLDSIWADPTWCEANESPLACEYRVSDPAFAIIMFGTNDVFILDAASYDFYLRTIVLETIANDIVPILNTFPARPEFPEKSVLFNQIVVQIAEDYDVPLINLWTGLQVLPNQGVDTIETIHLTIPEDEDTGVLTDENLEFGYTYRNLITLQAMQQLLSDLEQTDG